MTEFARNNEQQIRTAGIIFRVMMLAHCLVSNMRAELSSDILKKYGSARQAGVAGGVQAALCLAGAAFSIKGIALGGAYGNLMSRIGDMFSIAFNLKSYF